MDFQENIWRKRAVDVLKKVLSILGYLVIGVIFLLVAKNELIYDIYSEPPTYAESNPYEDPDNWVCLTAIGKDAAYINKYSTVVSEDENSADVLVYFKSNDKKICVKEYVKLDKQARTLTEKHVEQYDIETLKLISSYTYNSDEQKAIAIEPNTVGEAIYEAVFMTNVKTAREVFEKYRHQIGKGTKHKEDGELKNNN